MQLQLPRLDRMCMPLELQKPDPAGYRSPVAEETTPR